MPLSIRPVLSRLAVLVALLGTLVIAPAARANSDLLSIMMDDDQLVYRDDATRDRALKRMAALGVDYVRVTLLWSVVADGARATKALDKRFKHLKASNPKAYPKLNWDRYDRLVRAARNLHMGIYFNVTGPGPAWGHKKPPASQRRNHRTWMPKAREYYKFVQAVGKRYSGTYRDENDERQPLPRVSFWSLWNEPNQAGWLTPQWWRGKPYSPALYRQLHMFGVRALISTGHAPGTGPGKDVILAGETAPIGNDARTPRSPMRPKLFTRELLCAPGTSGVGCSDFQKFGPLQATGWAHHPYTKKLSPFTRDPNPDSITMANIGELPQLLDELANSTHNIAPGLPVFSTEYGYETNPPDPFSGIPLETQAQWLTAGDYLAYKDPRVVANTQFLLNDVAPLRKHAKTSKAYWFTYQSGLFGRSGVPKPSAAAYTFPFLAFPDGADPANGEPLAHYWGMLRFRPNYLALVGANDIVHLQSSTDGKTWTELGTVTVNDNHGLFEGKVPIPKTGYVRGVWSSGGANPVYVSSRPTVVTVPEWTPPPPPPAPEPPPPPPGG